MNRNYIKLSLQIIFTWLLFYLFTSNYFPTISIFLFSLLFLMGVLCLLFLNRRKVNSEIEKLKQIAIEIEKGNFNLKLPQSSELNKLNEVLNKILILYQTEIIKLKKIENYRSEFLGNVSHELRTPIFTIQSSLETLLNGAIDDDEVNRDFLGRALNNSNRLNALLSDLMDISSIETGALTMSFRYFDAVQFFEILKNEFEKKSHDKNINLNFVLQNNDLKIYGDKDRLHQVMTNLIENAIKYSPSDTNIYIEATETEKSTTINVKDEGDGIPLKHQKRIFERFYRIDKARSRDVGGTGLGLAIVKHIIEAHNSTINVESEIGKGSHFYFSIPK